MIGIYKITNTINGKVYIGQSWHLEERTKSHFRNAKKGIRNSHLCESIRKYGEENFIIEIVEICSENITQSILDELEIKYINEYNSRDRKYGYNIREGGSRGLHSSETKKKMSESQIGKKHTEESIQKMSESLSGKNHPMYGKHHSIETRNRISKSNIGRVVSEELKKLISERTKEAMKDIEILKRISDSSKNREYSEEYRELLSDRRLRENNPFFNKKHTEKSLEMMRDKKIIHRKVLCVEAGVVYENSFDAANEINGHSCNILKVCYGIRKKANGFSWKFVDEYIN